MYLDNKDEKDLVIVSIGLNKIIEDLRNLTVVLNDHSIETKKGLSEFHNKISYHFLGENYSVEDILKKSRSKLQAVNDIREMYNQIDEKYKSVFGKDIGDFLKDKR